MAVRRRRLPRRTFKRRTQKKLNKTQIRQVKRAVRTDKVNRFFPVVSNATLDTAGTMFPLSQILHGTGAANRQSDLVRLVRLRLNYQVQSADETNMMRVILFRWHADTINTTPAKNTLLDTVGNTGYPWLAQHRYQDPVNYTVIYDALHNLQGNGLQDATDNAPFTSTSIQTRRLNIYGKKLGNSKIQFDDSVSLTTGKQHIYMFVCSDSAVGSITHPSILYDALLEFESL